MQAAEEAPYGLSALKWFLCNGAVALSSLFLCELLYFSTAVFCD